jgi:toxin ParE1/3/4
LEQIAAYISQDKPEAASDVILNIIQHTQQLAKFPNLGRPGRKEGTRELIIGGTPFIVVYRQTSVIEIVSVFHSSMMP